MIHSYHYESRQTGWYKRQKDPTRRYGAPSTEGPATALRLCKDHLHRDGEYACLVNDPNKKTCKGLSCDFLIWFWPNIARRISSLQPLIAFSGRGFSQRKRRTILIAVTTGPRIQKFSYSGCQGLNGFSDLADRNSEMYYVFANRDSSKWNVWLPP